MAEQQNDAKVIDIKGSKAQRRRTKRARLQALAAKGYMPGRASTGMLYVLTSDGRRLAFTSSDRRKLATDLNAE